MINEILFRRPHFRPGRSIRLGDGQGWIFPAPPGDSTVDPDYTATVMAVPEAEDRSERLRAELALAIALLDRNYDLGPVELQGLLRFPTGSPECVEVQRTFRELAPGPPRRR